MLDDESNFFTKRPAARFSVPHAPLGERWLLVTHAALTAAFIMIRKRGFDLRNAGENAITNELEGVLLNDLLDQGIVDGFSKIFFGPVTRGSEVENYSGKKIGKKPDLVFHLQRENSLWDLRQDALFAECKPVDREHALASNYCAVGTERVGIGRFIIGDYAWAMHEAMMIGYVRDGFHIQPHLAASLADRGRYKSLGQPTVPKLVDFGCSGPDPLHLTRHVRRFVWKENGQVATSITLYHSWHDCS